MSEPTEVQPFKADPGGVFASDLHRRICGHLPHADGDDATPSTITVSALADRLAADPDSLRKAGKYPNLQLLTWSVDDLGAVLEALAGDGYASATEVEGENVWTASDEGIAALTGAVLTHSEGGKLVEPPPMRGARLKEAEAANKAEAEAAEAVERENAAERVKRAKAELAAALAAEKELGE